MKECPFCSEEIQDSAKKCRYCWEFLVWETIHKWGIIENSQFSENKNSISNKFLIWDFIKKYFFIFIIIIFFIVSILFQNKAEKYNNEWFELMINWQYDQAIQKFDLALEKNKNYLLAYNNKAQSIYERDNDAKTALEVINQAFLLEKNQSNLDSAFFSNRCMYLHELKRYDEALVDCDIALEKDPNDSITLNNKSLILYTKWNIEEALILINKSIENRNDNEKSFVTNIDTIYSNKWLYLSNLWRLEESIDFYKKALAINPNNQVALSNYSLSLFEQEKYEEALDHINRAIDMWNSKSIYFSNRASILDSLERYEEALLDAEKAIELDQNNLYWFYWKSMILFSLEDYQSSLNVIFELTKKNVPESEKSIISDLELLKCFNYVLLEKYGEWINICDNYISKAKPTDLWYNENIESAKIYKWIALAGLDRIDEARDIFEEIYDSNPDNAIVKELLWK